MLTESSKPTKEKNARDVTAVRARNMPLSSEVSKMTVRLKSALPWAAAQNPTRITISRPVSSMHVSTTLSLTDSDTPRRLINARIARKATATMVIPSGPTSRWKPLAKLEATVLDAVAAEVSPEHSTANVTRNVRKWIPNALCV